MSQQPIQQPPMRQSAHRSPQRQPGQTQMGSQMQMEGQTGGQMGGQFGQSSQQELSKTFGQGFTQQAPLPIQELVKTLDTFENVSEWVHSKAMKQGDHTLAKYTNDLAELSRVQKRLLQTRSPFAETYANCTEQAIQQSLPELQRYAQDPDVQEVAQYAQTISTTINQALPDISQWSSQGIAQGQLMGQQSGGQQIHQSRGGY